MRKGYGDAIRAIGLAISKPNQTVAIMSLTDLHAKANFRMYFEMVIPLFEEAHAKAFHTTREIKFSNGSRILFRAGEEQLRGLRVDDIVRD